MVAALVSRRGVVGLLLLVIGCLVAGCAVTPVAEKRAMRAELRSHLERIKEMADLANKAYDIQPPANSCRQEGAELHCSATIRGSYRAHYLVRTNDKSGEQIIAIRGTATWDDVRLDLETGMGQDPQLLVKVHSGFQKYAQAVFDDISRNRRLKADYRIYVTGHSLGGAAALLVGLYLYVDGTPHRIEGVYTFGQPKVFNNEGTTSWPFFSRRVVRVVDCADVVPIVPTGESAVDSLLKISIFADDRRSNYQHMGQSVLLMDAGKFWMPGQIELERDLPENIKQTVRALAQRRDLDHGIANYIRRIRAIPGNMTDDVVVNPDRDFPCTIPAVQAANR